MQYIEFKIKCQEDFREILIAELAEVGFDSFLETDQGIDAYIEEGAFDRKLYREVIDKYLEPANITVQEGLMEKVNWNEEWEKHYDPIQVAESVYVRASFHVAKPEIEHDILINPKMSFGTGHHATTFLMLSFQLTLDHKFKKVLDIGSGTGILAIMAHKLGASKVEAFDIDEWCVENGNENFDLNGMSTVKMGLGTVREVAPKDIYDIVTANINKNVLLDELDVYTGLVKQGGNLLLSGFYKHDIDDIEKKANKEGFRLISTKDKDDWAALILEKL